MAKEILYVVGNAKNVGKTTVTQYLLGRHSRACVASVGLDGEERDSVTGKRKPSLELCPGQYVVTCDQFLDGARFELLENLDENPVAGIVWLAKVVLQGKVVVAGATPKSLQAVSRLGDYDLVIVDGALDRLVHAGFADNAKVILVVGTSDFSTEEAILRSTERVVKSFAIPLAPTNVREKFSDRTDVCVLSEDGSVKELGESLLGEIDLTKTAASWVFVPGILTEEIVGRNKHVNFCLSNPFAFLGDPLKFGNIYTVKKLTLTDVYVNFFERQEFLPRLVKFFESFGYTVKDLLALHKEG